MPKANNHNNHLFPKNTETPKATWVQANHSVVPLYENQREINGSHINNGEIIFPQESDSPHKPKLDTELLQNKIIVPKGSEYAIVLADGTKVKMNADSHIDFPVQLEIPEKSLWKERPCLR